MSDLSPLSGVERKLDFGAVRSVFEPEPTLLTCRPRQRVYELDRSSASNGPKRQFSSDQSGFPEVASCNGSRARAQSLVVYGEGAR
jgi:hypothetical protein